MPFALDITPPTISEVLDGGATPVDLSCLPQLALPGCTWRQVLDDESGIRSLEFAIGSTPNGTDVHGFQEVPWRSSSATSTQAAKGLPAGSIIFCTVRVTNGAGAVVLRSSNGARLINSTCESDLPATCAMPVELGVA